MGFTSQYDFNFVDKLMTKLDRIITLLDNNGREEASRKVSAANNSFSKALNEFKKEKVFTNGTYQIYFGSGDSTEFDCETESELNCLWFDFVAENLDLPDLTVSKIEKV